MTSMLESENRLRRPVGTVAVGIDGIQYLRGIAALMVAAHHARHYFPDVATWSSFGSRGVDIFFVISGFIMAHTTASYRVADGRVSQTVDFVLKRFVRVVPLYWIALLWTGKRTFVNGEISADALKDFAFIPHFHAIYTGSIFPSLVPGWTINYEVFFYLLFAISMLFGRRRYWVLFSVMSCLILLGLLDWKSAAGIFYTSNILLEFLLGIITYWLVWRRPAAGSRLWSMLFTLAGFALLAIENGDMNRGLLDGPFAALIVGSVVLWAQGLKLDWLRAIGDASYAIYLFHLASFWIAGAVLHSVKVEDPSPLNIALVLATHLAIAVGAGLLIHRLLERPLLQLLRRGNRTSIVS